MGGNACPHRESAHALHTRAHTPHTRVSLADPTLWHSKEMPHDVGNDLHSVAAKRYILSDSCIGEGSFGSVKKGTMLPVHVDGCIPASTMVAVKICMVKSLIEWKCILRELFFLSHIDHPSIVSILGAHMETGESESMVSIVMPLMEMNLHQYLQHVKTSSKPDTYSITKNGKAWMIQLLRGVEYLHKNKIMHRDLKPANILVDHGDDLKICDLGFACSAVTPTSNPSTQFSTISSSSYDPSLSQYVVTLWYRPPELLLELPYGLEVDVWSLGCIFVEMFALDSLWQASDTKCQIKCIVDTFGITSFLCPFIEGIGHDQFSRMNSEFGEVEASGLEGTIYAKIKKLDSLPRRPSSLHLDHTAFDLVRRMLDVDPKNRASVGDSLKHAYFNDLDEFTQDRCRPYISDDGISAKPVAIYLALDTKAMMQEHVRNIILRYEGDYAKTQKRQKR